MKRAPALAMILAIALVARADPPRTLHEYVPDLRDNEGTLLVSSGGAEPDAIVYDGELLAPPEGGAQRPGEPSMHAGPGDGERREEPGRRSPTFRPDRTTELNGTIGYYEVFNPAIAPYKRVSALDAVQLANDGTPTLAIAASEAVRVEVEGASAPSPDGRPRDRFWGSVVLDLREGARVPFPSIAPDSRLLTLRTEPPAPIHIERDRADNLYAVAEGPQPPSPLRVIFLMDAPRTYFGMPLPPAGVRADALAASVAPLPPSVQRDAETFAGELGLTRASSFAHALSTLAAHFRAFEESAQGPEDTGNIYLDLARGMRGVCRHRAYGFVITARALGMPARFVQNEAHAWVEVDLPSQGWLRVELGGAAGGLERGAEDRPAYAPDVRDPLPRPDAFERAVEEARRHAAESAAQGAARSGSTGSQVSSQQSGSQQSGSQQSSSQVGSPQAGSEQTPQAGPRAPISVGPPVAERGELVIALDQQSFEVFRGRELELSGRVVGAGRGIAGLRVEALLRAQRADEERGLGATVTGEEGRFRYVFGVPQDLATGDYRLVVRTPGNAAWAPAEAR